MKKFILIILLLSSIQSFSKKPDPKDATIDSLTKANAALTHKLDSVSKDLTVYQGLYVTIKDKVLKNDFDPARFSDIVDSLRASRESEFTAKSSASATKDSLALLNSDSYKYKTETIDAVKKHQVYDELKQLKDLLDDKILTFDEFDQMKKKLLVNW